MREISRTQSLCSKCLGPAPAGIFQIDNRIVMRKECPRHGPAEVLIASDARWHSRMMAFSPHAAKPGTTNASPGENCPFDCGYCASHAQRMHLPVVPVTSDCDLDCPVCYTINKTKDPWYMSTREFAEILKQIRENDPDMRIINFTGGEPLMHPGFCELVRMCGEAGVHRITVSTNGLRFLEEESLLPELTELGARIVLSFNSFESLPYRITAGRDLLEKKRAILKLLERYKPSTTLLSVVAAGVNDREIGTIVRHVLESDFIVSSEIHTVAFTGRSIGRFDPAARLTPPDVAADIVEQNEAIEMDDFLPSPCAHPLCYSTCYLLKTQGGEVVPFTKFIPGRDIIRMMSGNLYIEPTLATEEVLTDALNDVWSKEVHTRTDERILSTLRDLLRRMFPAGGVDFETRQRIAETSTKAIYIHSHMDAENFDMERIKYCCGAVPDGKGGAIPTCAYNLHFRARDPRFCDR